MAEIIKGRYKPGMCGPACLAWACYELTDYYPSQKQIAREMGINEEWGTTGEEMLKGVAMLGLTGEWVQKGLDELKKELDGGSSVIVNYMSGPNQQEDGHYSVLSNATRDTVTLQDPEWIGSLKIMHRKLFEGIWWDVTETGEKLEKWALIVKRRPKR